MDSDPVPTHPGEVALLVEAIEAWTPPRHSPDQNLSVVDPPSGAPSKEPVSSLLPSAATELSEDIESDTSDSNDSTDSDSLDSQDEDISETSSSDDPLLNMETPPTFSQLRRRVFASTSPSVSPVGSPVRLVVHRMPPLPMTHSPDPLVQ